MSAVFEIEGVYALKIAQILVFKIGTQIFDSFWPNYLDQGRLKERGIVSTLDFFIEF